MTNGKLLLSFLFLFLSVAAFSQADTVRLKQISKNQRTVVTDRPPQAVFLNLGGYSPILGAMYDRRLANKVNGLGFSVGLGFWGASGEALFSVPLSLNYLIGKQTHFIELGAGTTYITGTPDMFDTEDSHFIHHINAGYRHQPTTGGFFFRGGISPLFYAGENATSFYVGFGHNF